jgi:hypothetical protein
MSDATRRPDDREHERQNAARRKAYRSPRLVVYGSVARLTQGGTGPAGDGMTTMAML